MPSPSWLVVHVYEGDTLIHDDGRQGTACDAEQLLTDVFGGFVTENYLQPTDLSSIRAELSHAGLVLASLDGRDW